MPPRSPLIGKTLEESGLRQSYGLSVLAIERGGRMIPAPPPGSVVQEEDILFLNGEPRGPEGELEVLPAKGFRESEIESAAVGIFEAVLSPRSRLIGQTLRDRHFRDQYGMNVIAIWRAGRPLRRATGSVYPTDGIRL